MDFIVSFSSIEHSGLGRYGDAMDPFGDIREMEKMYCLLKPGGILLLGIPSGLDLFVYNVHRQYGYIRWPMIAAGWKVLGYFLGVENIFHRHFPIIKSNNMKWTHYVVVLQK